MFSLYIVFKSGASSSFSPISFYIHDSVLHLTLSQVPYSQINFLINDIFSIECKLS